MEHIIISLLIFLIGIGGVFLSRRNIIIALMSLELMLLSVNLNFIFFSIYLDDVVGLFFSLFILVVGSAETAIGLSLVVSYYLLFYLN